MDFRQAQWLYFKLRRLQIKLNRNKSNQIKSKQMLVFGERGKVLEEKPLGEE